MGGKRATGGREDAWGAGRGGGGVRGVDGSPPQPPPAKYGGRHTVTLIPGDGIGPELMLHVKEVFRWATPPLWRVLWGGFRLTTPPPHPSRHACVPVDFEEVKVSVEAPEDDVHNAIMAIRRNGVALKGMMGGCPGGLGSMRGHLGWGLWGAVLGVRGPWETIWGGAYGGLSLGSGVHGGPSLGSHGGELGETCGFDPSSGLCATPVGLVAMLWGCGPPWEVGGRPFGSETLL